jgi:hypothetical protein
MVNFMFPNDSPIATLTPCARIYRGCPEQRSNPDFECKPSEDDFNSAGTLTEVVWVTPVQDATIFVDYDGDGDPDNNNGAGEAVSSLQSLRLTDEDDTNLSGALVWALDSSGKPVKIA